MKKLLLLMTLVICAMGVNAQSTRVITGAVIDKNGNPLPNALVEATGGAESVSTDADGTFSIEVPIWLKSLTAKYAGLKDKKIKIQDKSKVLFEMKPSIKGSWFLDAAYSLNIDDDSGIFNRLGLMGGFLGNWGAYAKIIFPLDRDVAIPSVTVGAIKQVAKPVYLYLGAGYSHVFNWDSYDGEYIDADGGMFEAGAIFKFNKVNFSVGYAFSSDFDWVGDNHSIQVSVGYCF